LGRAQPAGRSLARNSVTVGGGGGGGTVAGVFFSDFRNGTGTDASDYTDGSKWNEPGSPGGVGGLSVVNCVAEGVDFPMTNCLKVTTLEVDGGFQYIEKSGLGFPAAGASMWVRGYFKLLQTFTTEVATDEDNHPIQSGDTGDESWTFNTHMDSDTEWRIRFRPVFEAAHVFANAGWYSPVIAKSQSVRWELQVTRTTGVLGRFHARVYDMNNEIMFEDADFDNENASLTLADNPEVHLAETEEGLEENLDIIGAGSTGLGGSFWFPSSPYAYQGGFAVSHADWPGAFGNIIGEN